MREQTTFDVNGRKRVNNLILDKVMKYIAMWVIGVITPITLQVLFYRVIFSSPYPVKTVLWPENDFCL